MNTTDLMVGDWVNVNGLNLKVGAIHADEIGVFDPDFKIYWCSDDGLDRIDPIPLTEDILVKNGFKSTQGLDFYWFDDKKHCCMKNYDGKRLFCYKQGINDVWLVVKYVHQLQHLLRLCNVQKEIEL